MHLLKQRPLQFSLWLFFLWLNALCYAQTPTVSLFNAPTYPIWSELSYFERDTLSRREAAKKGDPDALLAFYLMASGNRSLAEYDTVKDGILKFVDVARKALPKNENDSGTARWLLSNMHHHFFKSPGSDRIPAGYDADQSKLMAVFETKQFNCVSSSLLYAVLARHFDLSLNAAFLPSHVFLQLQQPAAPDLIIETTNASGFDQAHDEAFYEQFKHSGLNRTDLPPPTYKDYLQREVVSLYVLAARNMLNQHTAAYRMNDQDSGRLAEMSAFLDATYLLAQEKRLYFYQTEIQKMMTQQQWADLNALFKTTYARTLEDAQLHPSSKSLQFGLQRYMTGALLTYAHLSDADQTLGVLGDLLAHVAQHEPIGLTRSELEQDITNAISVLLTKLSDQKRFNEGLLVLSLVEAYLSQTAQWPDLLKWFYFRWAHSQWQAQQWAEVIVTLNEYRQAYAVNTQTLKDIFEMSGSAYHNWVLELLENRDLEGARKGYKNCIKDIPLSLCEPAKSLIEHFLDHTQQK